MKEIKQLSLPQSALETRAGVIKDINTRKERNVNIWEDVLIDTQDSFTADLTATFLHYQIAFLRLSRNVFLLHLSIKTMLLCAQFSHPHDK